MFGEQPPFTKDLKTAYSHWVHYVYLHQVCIYVLILIDIQLQSLSSYWAADIMPFKQSAFLLAKNTCPITVLVNR